MMMTQGSSQPIAIGAFLSDEEIEKVAKVLYSRFYQDYGFLPSWNDPQIASIKRELIKHIKMSLDSLSILGYRVEKVSDKPILTFLEGERNENIQGW